MKKIAVVFFAIFTALVFTMNIGPASEGALDLSSTIIDGQYVNFLRSVDINGASGVSQFFRFITDLHMCSVLFVILAAMFFFVYK